MRLALLLSGVGLLLAACAGPIEHAGRDEPSCAAGAGTTIPLNLGSGRPLAVAVIEGTPILLQVDTGASSSSLTPEAAGRIGLEAEPGRRVRVAGTGGITTAEQVQVRRWSLGPVPLPAQLMKMLPLPGNERLNPPAAGLLGADVLSRYEVELDLPASRMVLRSTQGCTPGPPAWTDRRVLTMPARPMGRLFLVDVAVGEQPIRALLDTGASSTVMTDAAARRLGASEETMAAAPGGERRGVDGSVRRSVRLRFPEVRIGTERFRDAPVSAAPMQLMGGVEMLLGLDYARTRRFYLSYAAGRVWVSGPPIAAP